MSFETPAKFFATISERMKTDEDVQEELEEIGATYQFTLEGEGGGHWVIDCEKFEVTEGENEDADCLVGMTAEAFLGVVNGELNSQELFMSGELMIDGDMSLALRLEQVLAAGAE